jgi:hypothetical protein
LLNIWLFLRQSSYPLQLWCEISHSRSTFPIQIQASFCNISNKDNFFVLTVLVGETTGGGFETLRGYKTHCFISTIKSLQRLNKSFEYTPSLFLSSVSFFSFHTE